ncbi:hypothetical protein [Oceanobacillus sp. Castelsardo]|uniref:hypothetical protein n=1 Tax=Oceanobacillus sp. Castelsardo TaxID=1851204 RepID=UPI001E35DCB4|nr:hypothetical protein [Oceanobacillus sp. Castelsardo]
MKNIHNVASMYSTESGKNNSPIMDQDDKNFLEEQIEWCKQQDLILEKIEMRLREMRRLAEYSIKHNLTSIEIEQLNNQLNDLKDEVHVLQKKLQTVTH